MDIGGDDEETLPRALPRDVPTYHERQAAHFRALASTATTAAVKERLLDEAEEHEKIAREQTIRELTRSATGLLRTVADLPIVKPVPE